MTICYFEERLAYPSMPYQTQQILHDLTKACMDIELHAKMNFIPQIVFEILKFKKSCNLTGRVFWPVRLEPDFLHTCNFYKII